MKLDKERRPRLSYRSPHVAPSPDRVLPALTLYDGNLIGHEAVQSRHKLTGSCSHRPARPVATKEAAGLDERSKSWAQLSTRIGCVRPARFTPRCALPCSLTAASGSAQRRRTHTLTHAQKHWRTLSRHLALDVCYLIGWLPVCSCLIVPRTLVVQQRSIAPARSPNPAAGPAPLLPRSHATSSPCSPSTAPAPLACEGQPYRLDSASLAGQQHPSTSRARGLPTRFKWCPKGATAGRVVVVVWRL